MTDQNDLDGFLESAGIPAETTTTEAPATTTTPEPTTQTATERARDEIGRFAPAATTETAAQTPEAAVPHGTETVPLATFIAMRDEGKELKQQLQQMQTSLQALQQRPQAAPQPAQPPPKPVELWDDPDRFVGDRLSPIQKELAETRAQVSHFAAVAEFGKEGVTAAHVAIKQAIASGELNGDAVNQQLAGSRDPVGDIVRWHQNQKTKANMQRIGGDPDAWLAAELEKRMADPAFQAQVMERARGGAAPNGQAQTPLTQIPPSLSRIPSGANAATEADMSSEGLFRHALAR